MNMPLPMASARANLPEILDLGAATALAADLLKARGRDIELAGSSVRRLGAPALQVLVAAKATWLADGRAFTLEAPSAGFVLGLALLGAPYERVFEAGPGDEPVAEHGVALLMRSVARVRRRAASSHCERL